MQKMLLALVLLIVCGSMAKAQDYDTVPPYKKHPGLPSFQILQSDSTWFTDLQLPKHRPIIIMYFSPECGHCQSEAQDIVKHMDKLKKAFFVMVSYHSPQDIGEFAKTYKLTGFDNVRLGRDTAYNLPSFYRVQYTPFLAIYNKQGKLVKTFEMGAGAEKLAKLLEEE